MPKTVAIYGDSYVTRLRIFCYGDLRVPASVYWFEEGGEDDPYETFNEMLDLRPDVAVLSVCANDITSTTVPNDIINRIAQMTFELQEVGTSTVFITEILTRGDFKNSPDPLLDQATFDRKRKKINSGLAKRFKDKLIRFSDMRYPKDYSTDRVHLLDYSEETNNTGLKKYMSRIRRILCSLKN